MPGDVAPVGYHDNDIWRCGGGGVSAVVAARRG